MSDDLVKRLRAGIDPSTQITLGGKKHDGRSLEAADRIEALEAALESERAEATRRKWEDWRQIATLARASAEALEAALAEMTRRRDEWRKKAEGYDAVRLALREKVGTPWPPNMSRLLWAGIAADEKKRADDAEAAINAALERLDASLFTNAEHQQAKDILREATK